MTIAAAYNDYCQESGIPPSDELIRILDAAYQKSIISSDSTISLQINKSTGITLDDNTFKAVIQALQSVAKQVVKIEMRYQSLTDDSLSYLVSKLGEFVRLETIDFQCCDILGDEINKFMEKISKSQITTFILSGNRISSKSGVYIGQALANTKLEILELADCGLSADALIEIFSAMRSSDCMIRKLDVSGSVPLGAQQEIAYHIEDTLKRNPKLQRLHLRKMGIRDSGVERIASGVNFSSNLSYLDLSANKLSRDSALILSSVLNKLKVLDLSYNRIQSEGAQQLAKSVTQNQKSNLKVLGLTNADIDDDGICDLLQAYQKSNLETILLWGNRFEKASSEMLTSLMDSGALEESNTDCRANCGWHPDGTSRPAELSHHLRQFYWWTPLKGPEELRAKTQQPGII